MAKNTKSKINSTAVTMGAATVAAAAVGAYWLYGAKHATKHRKLAASWMLKARAEVMDAVEKIGDIDKVAYLQIVDDVIKKYAQSNQGSAAVAVVTKEIKAAWPHIQRMTKPAKKKLLKK